MRIAYLHYLCNDDTALHHVRQFADAATSLGHRVDVHAMNLAPDGNAAQLDEGGRGGVRQALKRRFGRYLHEPKEIVWNAIYARKELAVLRESAPDVLLVRDNLLTLSYVHVARHLRLPLVLEINAPAVENTAYLDEYLHLPAAGFLAERHKLRRADRIVVVSEALRSYLIGEHHLDPEKVAVNHNGADCDLFRPDADANEIRQRHRLQQCAVVGFVGSLHAWRGPELLRQVIDLLDQPRVRFLLVGDGVGWDDLRSWAARRSNRDRIAFAGKIDHRDVPAYVAAMDVAFLPDSAFYMSPLKAFEYMAAARAIVAPRLAPLQEIIDDGRDGLLFEPRDPRAAVAAIETLLRDDGRRRELGRRARERVLREFTWRHNAERVLAACHAALGRPATAAAA